MLSIRVEIHASKQLAQVTLPQHSDRLSSAKGFSDFSSYGGVIVFSNAAQVQQASSIMIGIAGSRVSGMKSNRLMFGRHHASVTG